MNALEIQQRMRDRLASIGLAVTESGEQAACAEKSSMRRTLRGVIDKLQEDDLLIVLLISETLCWEG